MAPPILPALVGPEVPLTNAGFTTEGQNGVTASALPVQSQYPNFGNTMEVVDKSVHLAAHQHIPGGCWNVITSPGENGITAVGLPIESHDIISQHTMRSHMMDSSSGMDSRLTENVLPSEPPGAPISSFQSSSSLPCVEGNCVMKDFQSIDSDDILRNWWTDNPPDDDMFVKLFICV
ncbi:hypothetical protein NL676_007934 [Syzygium grande]|nr:hypothetical protein NL676_007934 [Syzygium grande]